MSRETFVPVLELDRGADVPLHRQIHGQIARAFRSGGIPAGARLPSTRALARILRVSRNTVMAAYDELAADGWIRGERGSGTRGQGSAPPAPPWLGLRHVIRASGYPARILAFEDPDGNPLYLRR